jgi:endonuclease/exonuclease/phosphatase family metal-dependent hydrolase
MSAFAVAAAACGGSSGGPPEVHLAPVLASPPAVDTLRILAYNIHHGEGMDEVTDLERIAALIRSVDPDLVAVQEVDSVVGRTNGVDQAGELGRLTGMHPAFGRFMAYQGGAYGMAVLSRWPVEASENIRLPDGAEPRSSVAVTVRLPRSGDLLRFVGIHFYRTEEERLAQALHLEERLARGDGTNGPDRGRLPTILAGDFNSTPGSVVMDHLEVAWSNVPKGADRLTFPSWAPEREIDFVLVRPGTRFRVLEARMLDEPVASDHRPMFVRLIVER